MFLYGKMLKQPIFQKLLKPAVCQLVYKSVNEFLKLYKKGHTVKILKIGTPIIITIIVLLLEQLDFTVRYCVQKMQTE